MKDLNPENLHHAYILGGNTEENYNSLCDFFDTKLLFKIKANPDFWYNNQDRFTISDARLLREMQLKKTSGGKKKIFVFVFNFITREAQNALLKVLEEPTKGTHIFLITPTAHIFLDTVLSRVICITVEQNREIHQARKFIEASLKERMKIVNDLVEDIKKEKLSKADALALVISIEKIIHSDFVKNPKKEFSNTLREIYQVKDYLQDTGSSTKILLEHLVLNI